MEQAEVQAQYSATVSARQTQRQDPADQHGEQSARSAAYRGVELPAADERDASTAEGRIRYKARDNDGNDDEAKAIEAHRAGVSA